MRYLIAADFLMNAVAFIMLLAVDTALLAMAWGVFYGLAQGASVTLQRLAFADYFGRRPPRVDRGRRARVHEHNAGGGPAGRGAGVRHHEELQQHLRRVRGHEHPSRRARGRGPSRPPPPPEEGQG